MRKRVDERMKQGKLEAFVQELQVTNIDRPTKYEAAVTAKESARNLIHTITNLRAQKLTQANTNLLKVQVEANKTIDTAKTEASILLNQATSQAKIVYGQYEAQGKTYKQVRETRNLT